MQMMIQMRMVHATVTIFVLDEDDFLDTDEDTVVDCLDECPYDFDNDADSDGVCGDVDECPGFDDNIDTDDDGVADGCDECPLDQMMIQMNRWFM